MYLWKTPKYETRKAYLVLHWMARIKEAERREADAFFAG
jgi:hypothetical protein